MARLPLRVVPDCLPAVAEPLWDTGTRQVLALMNLSGGPGREDEAVSAWAFELVYYFTRGLAGPARVAWSGGVYTVAGMIWTTHPGDNQVIWFARDDPPSIDRILDPERVVSLTRLYQSRRGARFDGGYGG